MCLSSLPKRAVDVDPPRICSSVGKLYLYGLTAEGGDGKQEVISDERPGHLKKRIRIMWEMCVPGSWSLDACKVPAKTHISKT